MPGSEEFPVGQLNPAGYPKLALAAGLIISTGALATTWLTRREIPFLRQHAGESPAFGLRQTLRELIQALRNRQFALVFIIVLISSAIGGTTANINIYMTTYFWGFTTEDLRWFALSAVGALLAFPLVAAIQIRWDKKYILLSCAIISLFEGIALVNLRFLDVLPQNGEPMLLVILVAMGVSTVAIASCRASSPPRSSRTCSTTTSCVLACDRRRCSMPRSRFRARPSPGWARSSAG
jgi:Na+/melibiose symporter-like transporter